MGRVEGKVAIVTGAASGVGREDARLPSRLAEPADIANLVLFLASDESRFISGAELRIDNGWLMWAD